jgi:hypothetical protein
MRRPPGVDSLKPITAGGRADEGIRRMLLNVETLVGHAGAQEPEAFWLGATRIPVQEIIDRWPSTEYIYFKLLAGDATYILRHDYANDSWELTMYHAPGQ